MRKKILLFILIALFSTLYACSALTLSFDWPTISRATTTTTLPVTVNGTITVHDGDYASYPAYVSESYELSDIEAYNALLLETRDTIRHSNVAIVATMYRTVQYFPGYTDTIVTNSSSGSGVLFKEDDDFYYVITNYHVIDDGGDEPVYEITAFGDDLPSIATLIVSDASLDLAVLKFPKTTQTDLHFIDYTTRLFKKMNQSELVMAVGNPLGLENNVTFGELMYLTPIENVEYNVILHSASIDNGSSGGALVDVDGCLLGINTWGTTDDDEQSFAIPVTIVYMFLVNNGLI